MERRDKNTNQEQFSKGGLQSQNVGGQQQQQLPHQQQQQGQGMKQQHVSGQQSGLRSEYQQQGGLSSEQNLHQQQRGGLSSDQNQQQRSSQSKDWQGQGDKFQKKEEDKGIVEKAKEGLQNVGEKIKGAFSSDKEQSNMPRQQQGKEHIEPISQQQKGKVGHESETAQRRSGVSG